MSSCHFFIPLSEEGREGSQQRSFEGKSSAPSAALRRDLPSLVSYVVRYIQQKRQRKCIQKRLALQPKQCT